MSRPIDGTPASRAPRLPASMIPGPPPVMIEKPARPSAAAVSRAFAYIGSSRGVRAEPKIETALPTCARRSKPSRSSSSIRRRRAASSSWETIAGESGLEQLLVGRGRRARVGAPELLLVGVRPVQVGAGEDSSSRG